VREPPTRPRKSASTVSARPLKTSSVFSTISRDNPVYAQAADLSEKQCVRVSGQVRGAASIVERSKVCDLDYYLDFESIEPCP
jgi:hypothetical protein